MSAYRFQTFLNPCFTCCQDIPDHEDEDCTIYVTTVPEVTVDIGGYRPGFGVTQMGDVVRVKVRPDGVAVVRWEAPAHMAGEYR